MAYGTKKTAEPGAALLTVADVARLLTCSQRQVYRLANAGQAPNYLKIGGATRWRRAEIQAWIAAGCPAVTPGSGALA